MRKLKNLFGFVAISVALLLPSVSSATEDKSIRVMIASDLMKEIIRLEADIIFFTSKDEPIRNLDDIARNNKVVGVGSSDLAIIAANLLKSRSIKSAKPKESETEHSLKGIPSSRLLLSQPDGYEILGLAPPPDTKFFNSENWTAPFLSE